MKKWIVAVTAAVLIALPATASAHVTLNPNTSPAKGFTELLLRVPNEQDNANTTKVAVQFPPGFVQVSYQPKPGWTVTVTKRKLAKPVQTDDGPVSEEVASMTFAGSGKGLGAIAPGQFQDFPISVQVPDKANQTLWFPAVQTYSDGKVVRWITKDESADEPAPHLAVTAAAGGHGAAAKPAPAATPSSSSKDDTPSKGLVIAALIVGVLGLIAGLVALFTRRKTPAAVA